VSVRRIAGQLADLIEQVPTSARLTIVGHSLGGIVARYYVQEMGGHARVARTVSLASPFCGLDVPQLLVGADLHVRSPLLQRLRERAATCGVPHTSIVADQDSVVPGVKTACLGHGDVIIVRGRGHHAILFDPEVAGLVVGCLKRPELATSAKTADAPGRAW
jgi:pimeloyl-ACP methyl ester carboxylesterase